MGAYKEEIVKLARESVLADDFSQLQKAFHTNIEPLYAMVQGGRNLALHEGARARSLTEHAIELALVLEDALVNATQPMQTVSDLMVSSPVTAELWQPLSIVRQQMLINSFSYIPIRLNDGKWKLIADHAIVAHLCKQSSGEKKRRLGKSIEDAISTELNLVDAECIGESLDIKSLDGLTDRPVLVFAETKDKKPNQDRLVGILAAFDVL